MVFNYFFYAFCVKIQKLGCSAPFVFFGRILYRHSKDEQTLKRFSNKMLYKEINPDPHIDFSNNFRCFGELKIKQNISFSTGDCLNIKDCDLLYLHLSTTFRYANDRGLYLQANSLAK